MIEPSNQIDPASARFTFFTNHACVLLLIAHDRDLRMRELAAEIGITERAVQRIVDDLTLTGYLIVTKEGRRNHYQVDPQMPLRHRLKTELNVGELVHFMYPGL